MALKIKIGLTFRLLIAIALGIFIGAFAPEVISRVFVTAAGLVSSFLKFVIPLVIVAFVTMGIANLSTGAGLLLLITAGIAYSSSLISGTIAFLTADTLFPRFIEGTLGGLDAEAGMLSAFFQIPMDPIISVTGAVVLSFVMGLCISGQRARNSDNTLYKGFSEFADVVTSVLKTAVIPLLPVLICGTFVNMTVSGQTFVILNMLWKVFLTVIILHLLYLFALFLIAAAVGKRNPFTMMKNQIAGYMTAVGTQSSAATIPVNLKCAEANGVSEEIRNFTIPLCANIHMAGSMITITSCVTAVLLMNGMPTGLHIIVPFILTLGVAMIASPGAPGGSIMTALPFLPIVGIASDSPVAMLLVALYITQDSFGTACNVSGDNALSVIVDTIYAKYIKK